MRAGLAAAAGAAVALLAVFAIAPAIRGVPAPSTSWPVTCAIRGAGLAASLDGDRCYQLGRHVQAPPGPGVECRVGRRGWTWQALAGAGDPAAIGSTTFACAPPDLHG